MAKTVKIVLYYLPELDTLDLWIDDPEKEREAVPIGDNVVVKLDDRGRPIGVEILSLEKLGTDDAEKLPEELRIALLDTLKKLATKTVG